MTAGTPGSADETFTIGRVLAELKPDFPDLSLSKLRYLEAQGLVTPERRPSGYRRYAAADVDRLRYVLRAQQEWFWPLRVIRDAVEAMDRGLEPPQPSGAGAMPGVPAAEHEPVVAPERLLARSEVRLNRKELLGAAAAAPETLTALETYGLVRAGRDEHYGEDDLAIVSAAAALQEYGVEARHLRPFRMAADRELGLVEQVAAGQRQRSRDEDAATHQARVRAELLSRCVELHVALVRRGLTP